MDLLKYSKVFALAAVFALVAGCGGDANTVEDEANEVVAEEVHTSDEAVNENADAAQELKDAKEQLATIIPALNTVYFDFDKSTIRSEFQDLLKGHAKYLKSNPEASVKLEGHTDVRGSAEYNMALGERRGNAVQRFLVMEGVNANQLEVVSYGKMQLAEQGDNEAAHSKNRRVVIDY